MPQLIPGSNVLGHGFNGFGPYNEEALTQKRRLFKFDTAGSNTYIINNTTYVIPNNVDVMEFSEYTGSSQVFEKKTDVSEFFSIQAGLEGNYLAFSGAFDALFKSITNQVNENEFGMRYFYSNGFTLECSDIDPDNLDPAVKKDPDFLQLPNTFQPDDPQNVQAFFRFFDKYGTSFVNAVSMGGRLYYAVTIEKSHNFSSTEFQANLEAEYNATWGVKANSSAEWQRLSQQWTNSRKVSIEATGGNNSILVTLATPMPPDNYNDLYTGWIKSIESSPGVVKFNLMGIDKIFSGAQAEAVQAAADRYNSGLLTLIATGGGSIYDSSPTTGSIILSGTPLDVSPYQGGGVRVLALNRSTLQIEFEGFYPCKYVNSTQGRYNYTGLLNDVAEYSGNHKFILAFLFWGQNSYWGYPENQQLYQFLKSIGAGSALDEWTGYSTSASLRLCAYALVGIPGQAGRAIEDFAFSGEQFWSDPFPSLTLQAFLEPVYNAGVLTYNIL